MTWGVGCREGQLQRVHHVLNECLVDRGAAPNMVQLEAYVDGHHITTVQVDQSTNLGFALYSNLRPWAGCLMYPLAFQVPVM